MSSEGWNSEVVRTWLDSRVQAARLEQVVADKRGYSAQDEYDKAAAEEWVCQTLKKGDAVEDQARFAARLKELLAEEEYGLTGVYDDRRSDRHVRANLRKLVKMTKANEGFANTLRYQD